MQVFQLYIQVVVLSVNKYLYNCMFYAINFYKIQQCSIGKSDQRACLLYADRDACARHFPHPEERSNILCTISIALSYSIVLLAKYAAASKLQKEKQQLTTTFILFLKSSIYRYNTILIRQLVYSFFCILLLYLIFTKDHKLV